MTYAALLKQLQVRLDEDPDHVAPVLALIAHPDAVPARAELSPEARATNTNRLAERQAAFQERALPSDAVRAQLGGISRQALHQRVAGRRLLSWQHAHTSWFPDWQFGPDGTPLPGLPAVLAELPASPLSADVVMRTPMPEGGGASPAELLAAGQVELAVHYVRTAGGDR